MALNSARQKQIDIFWCYLPQKPVGGGLVIKLLRSCFNSPTVLAVSHTTCKQVLFEQLAKILSGGRSSQIVDLMQKLRERPTPKFSEAVVSCGWGGGRACRILDGVPRNGKWKEGNIKTRPFS
jgi:hypothetical protein